MHLLLFVVHRFQSSRFHSTCRYCWSRLSAKLYTGAWRDIVFLIYLNSSRSEIWVLKCFRSTGWFMAKGIANWHQVGFWDKSSLMVPVMCKICMFLTVSCTFQNLTVSFRYMNISLVMISLTHSLCFCTEQLIYCIWVVVNVVPLILDRIKF